MKKELSVFTSLMLLVVLAFAQAPQSFNYQAVARDNAGLAMPNQSIGIQISITDGNGGAIKYREQHTTTTNQFGLFTLKIGGGTPFIGTFATVSWSTIDAWMAVDMDPAGGTSYISMGTSQLVSVPYALYALGGGTQYTQGSGVSITGATISIDAQTDTTLKGNGTTGNRLGLAAQGAGTGQVLKYNGTQWVPQNDSVGTGTTYTPGSGIDITGTTVSNNAQTNSTLTGNGTTATPLGLAGQGAGTGEVLKYNGTQWVPGSDSVNIYTSGSGINVTGTTVNNNAQTNTTLTGNGTTGTPLGLAAQGAGTGQVLKYNGTQWVPQNDSVGTGTTYTPGSGIDITGTTVSNNAQTNTTLTGNGTTATPLGLAGQGAGTGEVLKYNGTQWVPGSDSVNIYTSGSGINVTGTTVNNNAQTNTTLTGNGTTGTPLGLASQGAGTGQVLKYNGTQWVPQNDSVNTGTIYTTGSGIDVTGTVVSLDAQTNSTLTGNGTTGTPLGLASQGAGTGQVLKYNGTQWVPRNDSVNIYTSGSGINVTGTTVNNNAQTNTTLTGNGTTGNPLGLASQGATTGQVLKYDGSQWVPQNDSVNTGTIYTPGSGIDVTGTVVSINAQTNTSLTGNGTAGSPLGIAAQGASAGQVLKYNGSQWIPKNDSIIVYTSGSGINVTGTTVNNNAQTNTTLTGNGTTGNPLGLAPQGATTGQVLKYDGSQWVPKNDSVNTGTVYTPGSGIDVTGTVVSINAQTNTSLTGNGTAGSPLGIAVQGASTGQVLKYNGTQWIPKNDSINVYTSGSGINVTGTTVNNNAQTNTTLTGNGTTGSPLGLAAQGATTGKVLKYDGSQWVPQNDSVGAPTIYTPGSGIDITGNVVSNNAQTNTTLTGNGTTGSPLGIAAQGASNGQVLKYNGSQWAPGTDANGGTVNGTPGYIGEFYSNNAIGVSPLFETLGRIGLYGPPTPDGLFSIFNDGTISDVPTLYINQRDRTGNSVVMQKNSPTSVDANLYLTFNSDVGGATIESHASSTGVAGYFSGENVGLALSATSGTPLTTALFNNGGNGTAFHATANNTNTTVVFDQNGTGNAMTANSNNPSPTAVFNQSGAGTAITAFASNATATAIFNQGGSGNAIETNAPIKIADGSERVNRVLTSDANGVGTWRSRAATVVTSSTSVLSILTSSFANESGGSVTITVPDSGTVLVESMVYILLDHTNGTDDKVALVVGATPTDGGSIFEQTWWSIPSGYPTFALTPYSLNVRRTFIVAPGTHTYYINGAMMSGLNADAFNYCNITATYFPQ